MGLGSGSGCGSLQLNLRALWLRIRPWPAALALVPLNLRLRLCSVALAATPAVGKLRSSSCFAVHPESGASKVPLVAVARSLSHKAIHCFRGWAQTRRAPHRSDAASNVVGQLVQHRAHP